MNPLLLAAAIGNAPTLYPSPWLGLWQAAITAAVSALVAIVALFFTVRENRFLQRERLKGDSDLARWKAEAEVVLAEKRIALERLLANWRRKTELAEQALTLAYEARDVFISARSRGMRAGEGSTRPPGTNESDEIKGRLDSYYTPIERLNRERELFSKIQSLRFTFAAYFGDEAAQPIRAMITVFHEIVSAASILMQMAPAEGWSPGGPSPLLQIAFASSGEDDPTMAKVDAAVAALEATCSDVLKTGADWVSTAG